MALRIRPLLACALLAVAVAHGDVLPPDEADAMYKHYEGGGIVAEGPAYLVRKSIGDQVSVHAEYEIDQVTGASIDMITSGASPLREDRKAKSLGVDYLREKTTYSLIALSSIENDYDSSTVNFSIAQSMFGDLTTVTLSASKGWDVITKRVNPSGVEGGATIDDPNFGRQHLDRRNWSLGISQIVTRNLIMGFNYEANTEQGYTQNPYRSIRYLDPTSASGFSFAPEVYPTTRTGNAFAFKAKYYLPWHAAANGGFRYYYDTWGIRAQTYDLGYTQPFLDEALIADVTYRYYTQNSASFYSDLFPRANYQTYMARDRELSSLYTEAFGGGISYDFMRSPWRFLKKSTISYRIDEIWYRYRDFRNAYVEETQHLVPGTGPLYRNNALSQQVYVQFYF
jgi:hypothetical protein